VKRTINIALALWLAATGTLQAQAVDPVVTAAARLTGTATSAGKQTTSQEQTEDTVATTAGTPPRVALVLAGGGSRGLAHIGAIRRLEELGVPVDIVCGTSMGALVGGLWSLGWSGVELDSLARRIDWAGTFTDRPAHNRLIGNARFLNRPEGLRLELKGGQLKPPGQLFRGNKAELLLSDLTQGVHGEIDFLALPRSFACTATDLECGAPVHLSRGSLPQALRASMSLPSIFEPVEIEGRVLVDGGLTQNLPTDLALRLGAGLIVAVDLPVHLRPLRELDNLVAVADQSRQILTLVQERQAAQLADLVISPDVSRFGLVDFEQVGLLMELGYQAVLAVEPELIALLTSRGVQLHGKTPPVRLALPDSLWLASLRVEGSSTVSLEQAERLLGLKRGDTFSPREVSRRVRDFISSRLAQRAGYEITLEDPDIRPHHGQCAPAALLLQVDGPSQSWLELRPGYNEHDQVWLEVGMDWDRPRGPGSLLRLNGRFGGLTELGLDYWRSSFLNSGLYHHPHARYSNAAVKLRGKDSRPVASYDLEQAGVGLGSGVVLRRGTRLEGSLSTVWARATPEIADTTWVRVRERAHVAGLSLEVDTRNSLDHPTHGFIMTSRAQLYQPPDLERERYARASITARVWHSAVWHTLTRRLESSSTAAREAGTIPYRAGLITLESGLQAGFDLKGELPPPFYFPMGGWPQTPGMSRDERWAPRLASGWLGLRVWLNRSLSVMPVAAVARSERDLALGGRQDEVGLGMEVALRTLLGPLRLAAGTRPGKTWEIYLRLGWE
jgi:NTE family protein